MTMIMNIGTAQARAQSSGARGNQPTTPGAQTTPREPTVPITHPITHPTDAQLALPPLSSISSSGKECKASLR